MPRLDKIGLFQKKSKHKQGVEDIPFWKLPRNFSFFCFKPGNSRQSKAQLLDIPQNCVKSLGNSKAKYKDSSWKFHIIFPWSPLEIPPLPPGLDFFWNSPCSVSYVNRPMKRKFTQENEQGLFLPKKPKHQV